VVSSNEVARRAGVSQSTVSRTFRGSDSVTEATRRRVLAAARELGYAPNVAARALVRGRFGIVGVVVSDLENPYFPRVIDILQRELADRGYRTALIWDRASQVDDTSILAEASVDAAVFMSALPGSSSVSDFQASYRPVVQISRYDPTVATDLVVIDELLGARHLMEHLRGLGHRRVGALFGPVHARSSSDREDALRQAAVEHDLVMEEHWVARSGMDHDEAKRAATNLLHQHDRPTALVGAGDVLAIGILDAARSEGLRVPEDLSVLGFDDSPPARWSMIDLTGLQPPLGEMARRAVDMLLEHLDDPASWTARREEFPVTLRRGSTSGPVP
jgi:LacI family transcriptional regulator